MFDIGWTEMLVVAMVMILVVGPKELPGMLRSIGKTVGNLKRMASDFQRQFSDALRESEFDEMKNELTSDIKDATSIGNPLDDINTSANELMASLDGDVDLDEEIIDDVLSDKISAAASATKPGKKPVVNKPTAKRSGTKSVAGKRVAKKSPVKKAGPKKAIAKKTVAKKPAAKRKVATSGKTA